MSFNRINRNANTQYNPYCKEDSNALDNTQKSNVTKIYKRTTNFADRDCSLSQQVSNPPIRRQLNYSNLENIKNRNSEYSTREKYNTSFEELTTINVRNESGKKRPLCEINLDNQCNMSVAKRMKKSNDQSEPISNFSQLSGHSFVYADLSDEEISIEDDHTIHNSVSINPADYLLELEKQDKQSNVNQSSGDRNLMFFQMKMKPPLLTKASTKFSIGNEEMRIRHCASGTFHDVFFIENRPDRLLKTVGKCSKWSDAGKPITATHDNQKYTINRRHAVLYQGFKSYKELQSLKIRVPKIFNEKYIFQDGCYLIENIKNKPSVELWGNSNKTIEDLKSKERSQLLQVKECMQIMKQSKQLLIPDFKPHNAGFNDKNELVILDFCEDNDLPAFQKPLDSLLEEYAEAWANGNVNIKNYLLS